MEIQQHETSKETERGASVSALREWVAEAEECSRRMNPKGSSAVLIPVLIRDGAYHVLYEIRASKLKTQPGEICFPGGRIEEGEEPLETAVREAMEELLISREQIEVVGSLNRNDGPGGTFLYAFIGVLHDYNGTWSADEVDKVFTIPLDRILETEPEIYRIRMKRQLPEDFPYEYVPGGKEYHWRDQTNLIPFYPEFGKNPVLWGATARVTWAFARFLRAGRQGVSL
ncbi:MAG: CoA pyrophosphatase [Eubacteriales bacterium]|nr:CoA pyrophosphatase [Eubacteriales bacterium]